MHLKRWLTSIVGIPVLVILILKGGETIFALFISLVMAISLWEYFFIVFGGKKQKIATPIPVWSFLTGLLMIFFAYTGSYSKMLSILMINIIGAAALSMPKFKEGPDILTVVAKEIQGIVYICLALSTVVLTRNGSQGVQWIFFLLFIVFAGDTGAYYSGTYLGRHKLNPSISPGKTLEGAAGGVIGSVIIGYGFKALVLPELAPLFTIILIIAVNIAGQAGDLFESELKRAGNVKDSGVILPGHGGLLDRIDGVLFAAPVMFVIKEYVFPGI